MRLLLQRFSGGQDDTLGVLFEIVDGLDVPKWLCCILEDEFRAEKVAGETRVPAGTYDLKLRETGGRINPQYAARYPFHRGMLWLQDVPGFRWVYLHTGNDDDDTAGCLLVGDGLDENVTGNGRVTASRQAYRRIYPPIADAIADGESVTITIRDEDWLLGGVS